MADLKAFAEQLVNLTVKDIFYFVNLYYTESFTIKISIKEKSFRLIFDTIKITSLLKKELLFLIFLMPYSRFDEYAHV